MKKFIAVMTTAALLLSALLAFVPAFAETKIASKGITVPKGYDPNSYLKLRAFFEIEDENGVKNGDKLWTNDYYDDENIYDPDDPETWYSTCDMEGQNYIAFEVNEEGLLEVCGFDFNYYTLGFGSDFNYSTLVGELDISGISKLYTVATYGNEGITGLNTEGCDIERLYCYGNSLSEVDWCCEEKDIFIHLTSVGSGFVSVDYDTYEDEWEYWTGNAYWCVYARPVQGKEFIGWYDENGNCVGNDLKYEFAVAPDNEPEEHWGDSPTDIHLNLEARFETASGDYDCNREVNVQDAILTLRAAMELITPSKQSLINADMDGNGVLTVTDAITVLRMAMGLI